MLGLVAATRAPFVCMHWRAHSANMQDRAIYADVVAEVITKDFQHQVDDALAAGVQPGRLIIDPGVGFAKNSEHNWQLLKRLGRPT